MGTLALRERAQSMRRPVSVKRLMLSVMALNMSGLPRTTRDVLLYLVSLVDAGDHQAPVFPQRETIAAATGLSLPTVYRHLKALAAAGYIERMPQRHDDAGTFADAPLCLMSRVLSETAAGCDSHDSCGAPDAKEEYGGTTQDRLSQGVVATDSPSINLKDALYVDLKKTSKESLDSGLPHTRPKTNNIPASLQWLLGIGLDAGKILSLMVIAKRAGVWLQDLIEVKRDFIADPKSGIRSLFAYLRSLLLSDTDWAWVRKRQAKQTVAVVEKSAAEIRMAEWAAKLAGTDWRHKDGRRLSFVSSGFQFTVFTPGKGVAGGPISLDLIEAIERGFLVPAIDD